MSRSLLFLVSFFVPGPVLGQATENQDRTRDLLATVERMTAVDADGCLKNRDGNEIVVCGISEIDRKQRLPFPQLVKDPNKRVRDPIPKGNPEIVQQGRCYVTMDERNCFKGLPLVSIAFGGEGGSVNGPAGRLWRIVDDPVPEKDYVKQVQVRANGTE